MTNPKQRPALCAREPDFEALGCSTDAGLTSRYLSRPCFSLLLVSFVLLLSSFVLCAAAEASGHNFPGSICSPHVSKKLAAIENSASRSVSPESQPLLVVGFMGGRVSAANMLHSEAILARDLQQSNRQLVHTVVFANHNAPFAFQSVLKLLDTNRDGTLSAEEKYAARIVIYGHSWGASEAITLADRLNAINVPVLLTVQVDSVQKAGQDDARIPPNVGKAINFYQAEGLLHGRATIYAANPDRTEILGNHESVYRRASVSCAGYPWYARLFMKEHIEIENDPRVWNQIRTLVETFITPNVHQGRSSS